MEATKNIPLQSIETEFELELPFGYVDGSGTLHKKCAMRLACARDEIEPLKDPRVQENEAYLIVILLARVLTRLGTLPAVDTDVIENLFVKDLDYLQQRYNEINYAETSAVGE